MEENKKIINGYLFESNQEYIKAQREKQVVDQMKKTMDWKNPKTAYKLYLKILDRNSFTTIIGIHFLWELRSVILRSGIELDGELPSVPVNGIEIIDQSIRKGTGSETVQHGKKISQAAAGETPEAEKYRLLYEEYKEANRVKKIIIAFLLLIIIGILTVSQLTPYSIFTDYENKIINQYEEWEKELEEREAAVTERENALKGQ